MADGDRDRPAQVMSTMTQVVDQNPQQRHRHRPEADPQGEGIAEATGQPDVGRALLVLQPLPAQNRQNRVSAGGAHDQLQAACGNLFGHPGA